MKRFTLTTLLSMLIAPVALAQADNMANHMLANNINQHEKSAPAAMPIPQEKPENPNAEPTKTQPAEATPATPIEQNAPVEAAKPEATESEAPKTPSIEIEKPSDSPMQFSLNSVKQSWIVGEGEITPDTVNVFTNFLQNNNIVKDGKALSHKIIVLHSNGGDLLSAMALGQEIRNLGFDTSVASTIKNAPSETTDKLSENALKLAQGVCKNACLWAFLGGNKRMRDEGDIELQTYRPPLDGASTKSGQEVDLQKQQLADIAYIVDYAYKMKFDPTVAFIDWQNAKPHAFTPDELHKYRVTYNPKYYNTWTLQDEDRSLIGVSISDDGLSEVKIFTNKQKYIFVELSQPIDITMEQYESFIDKVTDFDVFGFIVKKDNANLSFENGQLKATFTLPQAAQPPKATPLPKAQTAHKTSKSAKATKEAREAREAKKAALEEEAEIKFSVKEPIIASYGIDDTMGDIFYAQFSDIQSIEKTIETIETILELSQLK